MINMAGVRLAQQLINSDLKREERSANVIETICVICHRNRLSRLGFIAVADGQAGRRTDGQAGGRTEANIKFQPHH